ncbi:hypothetical protein M405DRAFT_261022 [Rhizopogon salebrosus TDB-379]|nr:hypothetical protein M405DRAFT_261022 [Rhizopogon salebrosus TDB-379]
MDLQSEYTVQDHPTPDRKMLLCYAGASTRIMNISELRWKIFQLVSFGRSRSRNRTLLALALTCKSFTELALDLLWRKLDRLSPLIRCLPPSLWTLSKEKLEFRRAMTIDDWSIFCKYNHRVQAFHTKFTGEPLVSADVWRSLICAPFPLPLLPNLTSLTWHEYSSETFLYHIRLFVTHKLTNLNISPPFLHKFSLPQQSILSCIPMLCPSVSHFISNIDSGDASITLQCWSHLISVKVGEISEAALLHLSNLPSLRVLHLKLHSIPIATDTQKLLPRPAFRALQELHVTCNDLAPMDAFFEPLSIAPKVLSFTISELEDSMFAIPTSISHLPNACAHSALENLCVSIDSQPGDDLIIPISTAVFESLCAFRNLRKFNFSFEYNNVELDDATLLQMAKAWPLLEVLKIIGVFYTPNPHNITAHGLVSLLQHCPRLTSISIVVNWSAVDGHDISPDIPYQGFAHKALSYADFSRSKVGHHTARVAAFLSAIAPKLVTIVAWHTEYYKNLPDFEKYSNRWKVVQQLVKSFSLVREQERRMVLNAGRVVVGDVGGSELDDAEDSDSEIGSSDEESLDSGNDSEE